MKSAGKARNNGLYRHIRTSKEIIRNLLNDFTNNSIKLFLIITMMFREGQAHSPTNIFTIHHNHT